MTDFVEGRLRAALEQRDPGPAPGSLLERVQAERSGARGTPAAPARVIGWATAAAGLAAVIALAAVAAAMWTLRDASVGAGTSPSPVAVVPPFDPTAPGSGIVERPVDVAVWLVLAAIAVFALILTRNRRGRVVGIILFVAILAGRGMLNAGEIPLVQWTEGSWQYGRGWAPPPSGVDEQDPVTEQATPRFVVGPEGVFTVGLDVHNVSPLPITIVGISQPPVDQAWGRWDAVGLLRDASVTDISTPADTRPFEPVEVGARQSIFLILAGRAGPCALDHLPTDVQSTETAAVGDVDVVYEVAGIRRVSTVTMPFSVQLPMDAFCVTRP